MENSKKDGRVVQIDSADQLATRKSISQMADIKGLESDELDKHKILHAGTVHRELLEVFRNLRTRLLQRQEQNNFVVLVSSACSGGGGSMVSLNLAAAFALDQSKTSVIVDCNVLNPYLDQMLSIPPDYGLTDYLQNPNVEIDDIIYASGIPRLRMVPAGARSELAAELFASEGMRTIIATLKERYPDRYIILDAPPISSGAEVRVLAQLCDQAIVVVPHGKVTQAQIMGSIDTVGRDKFVGVIFNN
ncbi:MAG: polysaccharide biosynthesis protein [Pseudomonadales bacterium]